MIPSYSYNSYVYNYQDERDLILKAAYNGDVNALAEFSMRGVDIVSACDWVTNNTCTR